jgi:chromosome segregation ATPase
MHRAWALAVLVLGLPAVTALAQPVTEIFKCRNEHGQVTYTNDRRQAEKQKCELVTRQQVNVAPAQARSPGFPRESAHDSVNARERQREILQGELASERESLTRARQALVEQEAVRTGDERNYARVQERLQPFKDTVENHEKNIQALQRELGNLK